MKFRIVEPGDEGVLAEMFASIDETFFRPHPFTPPEAERIANLGGRDVYALLMDDNERPVAYGMLRGWDEGYDTPSLGIAVSTGAQGQGYGRLMMAHLHHAARSRGSSAVRLRVHPDNLRARRLYESMGYVYQGEDRGELVMVLEVESEKPAEPGPEPGRGGPSSHEVRLLGSDDPAWDVWLAGTRHDVYHLAGWHQHAGASGEGEPYLAVVGDRERGLAWPYLLRHVSEVPELGAFDATDVHSVYGYPGPLAWGCAPDDPFLTKAMAEIVGVWRSQGAVAAFTRFHPLLGNARLACSIPSAPDVDDRAVGVVPGGQTVSVDLTLPVEAIRAAYGRDLRREIDASRRAGLVTVHDEEWHDLAAFAQLYRETMVKSKASAYYFFGLHDFERLRDAIPGKVHLLVTRYDDAVVAAGLFTELDGVVEWYLSGTAAAVQAISPTKVLVDDAIRWAHDRGNHVLHVGGGRGGRDDSLLWFKGRFSPRRHEFHTGRWVLDPERYRELVAARFANGPSDPNAAFFPAYRGPLAEPGVETPGRVPLPTGLNLDEIV